jgi:hypothetical protein
MLAHVVVIATHWPTQTHLAEVAVLSCALHVAAVPYVGQRGVVGAVHLKPTVSQMQCVPAALLTVGKLDAQPHSLSMEVQGTLMFKQWPYVPKGDTVVSSHQHW